MNLLSPTANGIMTGLLLLMFVGLWIWSWSAKRKPDFERMANLPLEDDLPTQSVSNQESKNEKDGEAL